MKQHDQPKEVTPSRNGSFLGSSSAISKTKIHRTIEEIISKAISQHSNIYETQTLQNILSDLKTNHDINSINPSSFEGFSLSHQEIQWLSKHSKEDWLKYLIYRYKFKVYPKQKKLTDFPLHLLIEPTPICNLRCTMCFQVDPVFKTKPYKGYIPFDLYKSLIDQAVEHNCGAVTLASRGEPTLHPRFSEMLFYLRDSKILDSKINTNATRLNEKLIHDILSANINEVVFSVDAGTKKTYEEIRVGGKFDKVVHNIELFNSIRSKHYPESCTVTRISGVKIREDQDQKQMLDFWSKRVDQVAIKNAIMRWDSYNNPLSTETTTCPLLWEKLYVWYDGTANPCDFDYQSKLGLGNVNNSSIKEIWNNKKFSNLRKAHLEANRNNLFPCDRCDYI